MDQADLAMRTGTRYLLAVLLVATPQLLAAQVVYRWTTEEGEVRYSDRPPAPGTAYERLNDSTWRQPQRPVAEAKPTQSSPDERQTETESAPERAQAAVEKDPLLCQKARQNLWEMDHSARIRIIGDDGSYRFLDEEEKEAERRKARQVIDLNC